VRRARTPVPTGDLFGPGRWLRGGRCCQPKELSWIDGATNVDLYDKDEYVPTAIAKLTAFFGTHLGKTTAPRERARPAMT
jgi:hypothetical protein